MQKTWKVWRGVCRVLWSLFLKCKKSRSTLQKKNVWKLVVGKLAKIERFWVTLENGRISKTSFNKKE